MFFQTKQSLANYGFLVAAVSICIQFQQLRYQFVYLLGKGQLQHLGIHICHKQGCDGIQN